MDAALIDRLNALLRGEAEVPRAKPTVLAGERARQKQSARTEPDPSMVGLLRAIAQELSREEDRLM
jgi:hypothetical protein